ncbi:Hypothetical protein HVR_LOCUS1054 [uncultured virus]|nr:Hypothetical protein HVR_LOCUS1054 [uncultured virus]
MQRKQGDWDCPCGKLNFASRIACFGCGKNKSIVKKPGDWHQRCRLGSNQVGSHDWQCHCGDLNFASRDKCRKCSANKPAIEQT